MKSITTIAALLVAMSTTAQAEGLSFAGEVAYSVDAETFVMEVGPSVEMYGVSIDSRMHTELNGSNGDASFTGTSVELGYGLSENLSAFGKVTTTKDLTYDDLNVGVRFNF